MFEEGLPLRGCVGFGEYFIYESMFSGRIISECYTESEKLEFSGVMITDECYKYIKENSKNLEFINLLESLIEDIVVPVKQNIEENRHILNWIDDLTWDNKLKIDIQEHTEKYVMEKFTAYKKTVNDKSYRKYINTVNVINELFIRSEKST